MHFSPIVATLLLGLLASSAAALRPQHKVPDTNSATAPLFPGLKPGETPTTDCEGQLDVFDKNNKRLGCLTTECDLTPNPRDCGFFTYAHLKGKYLLVRRSWSTDYVYIDRSTTPHVMFCSGEHQADGFDLASTRFLADKRFVGELTETPKGDLHLRCIPPPKDV
ncbi:MAG: hypothetical protein M1829_001961 [Trizodia sp. TS-e1964]|nr:MAG: hypothetical protein M1829_001961 [Trizodia sp. TS-e1964]